MNKSTLAISMFRSTFKYSDKTLPPVKLNDNRRYSASFSSPVPSATFMKEAELECQEKWLTAVMRFTS